VSHQQEIRYRRVANEGNNSEEVAEEPKQHLKLFYHCAFKKLGMMEACRKHFDNSVRTIYRQPDSLLK
jgi:hypothetical protein